MNSAHFRVPGKRDIILNILLFMSVICSIMLIQYDNITLFQVVQAVFCLALTLKYKKLFLYKSLWPVLLLVSYFLTVIAAVISNVRLSYTKAAIYMFAFVILIYYTCLLVYKYLNEKPEVFPLVVSALKLMCVIQMCWFLIQTVLYKGAGIDINTIVFKDLLHMVTKASFFKGGTQFMPSGFCWHPIAMAPVLVLAYLLFRSIPVKCIVLLESVLSGNATVFIAVFLCAGLDIAFQLLKDLRRRKVKQKELLTFIGVLILIAVVCAATDVPRQIISKIVVIYSRISGTSNDASAMAHIRYYTSYPQVVMNSNILQILFGYGEGCSGYPFSILYNQYNYLGNWAVESDIMNKLLSRGLFGFIAYYGLLLTAAIRSLKVNSKYFILFIVYMIAGITYNIQFDWVILIEVIMMAAISRNYDLFSLQRRRADDFNCDDNL